ncbi:MAG: hypothetical protein WC008_05685 [Bacilli bacterium]
MDKNICDQCGKEFFEEDAEDEFLLEYPLHNYSNLVRCLCGDCAIQAILVEDTGVYMETCEGCNKSFDPIEDDSTYRLHSKLDIGLDDFSRILCADCALEVELDEYPLESDFDEIEEDEEEDEDDEYTF